MIKIPLIICVLVFTLFTSSYALKSFPGAEGFGAYTPGGRGGKVLLVTNLNNDGPGSLRAACEATGPRIVVFRTSGIIELESTLRIRNPFITIAGQTAPGDGICLKNETFTISANDVIVRHLRVRPGDIRQKELDGLSIYDAINVILDHCSVSWGIDEVLSPCGSSDSITVQWCMITESLNNSYHSKGEHGYGSLIRPNIDSRMTFHHNLYAHHKSRNPRPGTYDSTVLVLDFCNNVIYDWGERAGYSGGAGEFVKMNYVGNFLKYGPSTTSSRQDNAFNSGSADTWIYQEGNLINGQNTGWSMISGTCTQLDNPVAIDNLFTTIQDDAQTAYDRVLADAGAVLPKRDAADSRVMQAVQDRSGGIINSQDEVGGWPVYASASPPADTDSDGMPDTWESARGLDPNDGSDANGTDLSTEDYTNIEVYINGLAESGPGTDIIPVKTSSNALISNHPNPFNRETTIAVGYWPFAIGLASINIHNINGKLVKKLKTNGQQLTAGIIWNAADLPSGIYFLRLKIEKRIMTKSILLQK